MFPGVIDGQVHAGSPVGVEGLADATIAAAAGGVTTIVDMPFDDPDPVNTVERLQHKVEVIDRVATVDVALYATARKGAGSEGIRELADAGACAFKVSTYEYHPVRFPGYDTGELLEIFPAICETGLSVAFHNEDPYIVQRLTDQLHAARSNSPASHGQSRPPIAELIANVSVFEIARITGVRCHIVHSSLARGFDHVKQYRQQGVRVSAETCIQYLVFCEDDVLAQGARLKQNPPIRSAAENAALWEKIVFDEVDFVSSDHVAWPVSRKSDPRFLQERLGSPGSGNHLSRSLHRHGDRARNESDPGRCATPVNGLPATSVCIRARVRSSRAQTPIWPSSSARRGRSTSPRWRPRSSGVRITDWNSAGGWWRPTYGVLLSLKAAGSLERPGTVSSFGRSASGAGTEHARCCIPERSPESYFRGGEG